MNKMLVILTTVMILGGCQQKKSKQQMFSQTVEQEDSTFSPYFINDDEELELIHPPSGTPVELLQSSIHFIGASCVTHLC